MARRTHHHHRRGSLPTLAMTCALTVFAAQASAATVLIDFGNTNRQTAGNWNNVVPATSTIPTLIDDTGAAFGTASLEVTDPFFQAGEPSQLGSEAPTGDAAAFPVSATDDYLFGHTGPFAGAASNPTAGVTFSGLDPDMVYDFTIFASRQPVGDNRETEYAAIGANAQSGTLAVSNNNSAVLALTGIIPDLSNEILLTAMAGPNNNNSFRFYFLGVVEVTARSSDVVPPVPVPPTLLLLGSVIAGAAAWRRLRSRSH